MNTAADKPVALSKSDWKIAPLTCCAILTGRRLSAIGVGLSDGGHALTMWGVDRLAKLGAKK